MTAHARSHFENKLIATHLGYARCGGKFTLLEEFR